MHPRPRTGIGVVDTVTIGTIGTIGTKLTDGH